MLIEVLAILALGQETVPTAPSDAAQTPPPAEAPPSPDESSPEGDLSAAPPLPTGALAPVGRDDAGETFLVVDHAQKAGDMVDYWTFEAFIPPIQLRAGKVVVQGLSHHQADCQARTDQTLASAGYDEAGTAIVALAAGPAQPLAAGSAYTLIADRLCAGDQSILANQVKGHGAALASALSTTQTPASQSQ